MEVDDRDDERQRQVLEQLRQVVEDVEKRLNRRMQVDIGLRVLGGLVLVVVAVLMVAHFGGAR